MNKGKLKKKIESNNLENIIKKCYFIGFFCIQNVSVNDNIQLKRNLKKQGFSYILIKNTAIFKSFFKSIPKMKGLVSGSLAICYSITLEDKFLSDINFISLSKIFSIIKEEKNIFFLGGFFEGLLVNRLFERQICAIHILESVQLNYISLIQSVLNKVIITTSKPKNQLSLLLNN